MLVLNGTVLSIQKSLSGRESIREYISSRKVNTVQEAGFKAMYLR